MREVKTDFFKNIVKGTTLGCLMVIITIKEKIIRVYRIF